MAPSDSQTRYQEIVEIRSKIYYNNKNTTVSLTFSEPYMHEYCRTVIVVYWKTIVIRSSFESFVQTNEKLE